MDMKKYCEGLKAMEPPLVDVPVLYLPCPHKKYKAKVVNRAMLTRAQYLELLATPKGFTWDKDTGLASPPGKRKALLDEEEMVPRSPLRVTDYRFINDFFKDTWKVMTPKYRKRLEKILIKEFGMTEGEAKEFLEEQKLRSTFSKYTPQSRMNLSPRHEWVHEIADLLAGKLTDCLVGTLTARRTKRIRYVAEALLKGFGDLTGEQCPLDSPQNGIQAAQVFAADRLAIWLMRILGHCDEELCREILKVQDKKALGDAEEDGTESEESDEEVEETPIEEDTAAKENLPKQEDMSKEPSKTAADTPQSEPVSKEPSKTAANLPTTQPAIDEPKPASEEPAKTTDDLPPSQLASEEPSKTTVDLPPSQPPSDEPAREDAGETAPDESEK